MKINQLVIEEIANLSNMDPNLVAESLIESDIHETIQKLSDQISAESEKMKNKGIEAA